MARTPDPEVAKKRKRAAELEREGMKARQIAECMGMPKVETVQEWLRIERGAKKPYRPAVIERLREGGLSFEEIAQDVGCSYENVRKIEREVRPTLEVDYIQADRRLAKFLADPEKERSERYTRYEAFQGQLVAHCNQLTKTDPKSAKPAIKVAMAHLSLLQRVLQAPEKVQVATCNLIQIKAINAARERMLDRPKNGLRMIRELEPGGCISCVADLARRESLILLDLGRFRKALAKVRESHNLYLEMGHSGHDASGNGLGNCSLLESNIYLLMGRPSQAALVIDSALANYVGSSAGILFFGLRFSKALALLALGDLARIKEARGISAALYAECSPAASVPRLRTVWLDGRTAALDGDFETAIDRYEDAYEDAVELKTSAFSAAILADLVNLPKSLESLGTRIDRLKVHHNGEPLDRFPLWLQPIEEVLRWSAEMATKDLQAALRFLRKEGGGDKALPLFAT